MKDIDKKNNNFLRASVSVVQIIGSIKATGFR